MELYDWQIQAGRPTERSICEKKASAASELARNEGGGRTEEEEEADAVSALD